MREGFVEGARANVDVARVRLVRSGTSPAEGMAWSTAVKQGVLRRDEHAADEHQLIDDIRLHE